MNKYQLSEFLRYKKAAKGRHGVHSPFVFDFIEQVLRKRKGKALLSAVEDHFGAGNMILADAAPPAWTKALDRINDEFIVLAVRDIHTDEQATRCWDQLSGHRKVKLSMDLFDIGLCFFRNDFVVKQHFVLKQY